MKLPFPEKSLTLSDIIRHHQEFEREKGIEWAKNQLYIRLLESISLLVEEIGELAHIINRLESKGRKMTFEDYRNIVDEFTDIFVYIIKIASYLGIDLETEYFRKMKQVKQKAEMINPKYIYSHAVPDHERDYIRR